MLFMERLQDNPMYAGAARFETVGEYLPPHLQHKLRESQLRMPTAASVFEQQAAEQAQSGHEDLRRAAGSLVAAGVGDVAVRATMRLGDGTADYAVGFVGAFIGNPDLRIPPSRPVVSAAGRYALAA